MEDILDLIKKREYYLFLLLLSVYRETKGRSDVDAFTPNLLKSMKYLLGKDFDKEYFDIATQYALDEGYLKISLEYNLTSQGRTYFDNLIKSLANASEEEKEVLKKKLPEKIKSYFNITSDFATIGSFLIQLAKMT